MNLNWKFSALAGWCFIGRRIAGVRFTPSIPSGPMPFNMGHTHGRGYIIGELGAERWRRRLKNNRVWRACHLYWRSRPNGRTAEES